MVIPVSIQRVGVFSVSMSICNPENQIHYLLRLLLISSVKEHFLKNTKLFEIIPYRASDSNIDVCGLMCDKKTLPLY